MEVRLPSLTFHDWPLEFLSRLVPGIVAVLLWVVYDFTPSEIF